MKQKGDTRAYAYSLLCTVVLIGIKVGFRVLKWICSALDYLMGYRLSKIYTRTGDTETTGLGDGERLSKSAIRVCAMGEVDELNSVIGVLLSGDVPPGLHEILLAVQHDLFDMGGELSIPGSALVPDTAAEHLEASIDRLNDELPPLKEFVLPGGRTEAAHCHLARAVCRRTERTIVELANSGNVTDAMLTYINRLSDLLFVVARTLARQEGGREVAWDRSRQGQVSDPMA